MNCDNCNEKMIGVSYTFEGNIFCGKSCLVKHLQREKVIKLKIIKAGE